MSDVVIVGAGLAGLSCALELIRADIEPLVLEASDDVGGRVRTDTVDGYLLDRGFQVLPAAYPSLRAVVRLAELDPRRFRHGALVASDVARHRVDDPLRHPLGALRSLGGPLVQPIDVVALGRLAGRVRGSLSDILTRPETTGEEALANAGVSPSLREGFLRPFFGGVLLDRRLGVSSRMLDFTLRWFVRGPIVVPARGMGRIPHALAERIPAPCLRLQSRVTGVGGRGAGGTGVVLDGGEKASGRAVVLATEGPAAAALLGGRIDGGGSRASTTVYFTAAEPPVGEATLVLNGQAERDARWPVNSVVELSAVSPAYAPAGRALLSCAIVGDPPEDDAALVERTRRELLSWFGDAVDGWQPLRVDRIRHALPLQTPPFDATLPVSLGEGVYVCGDHRDTGSIEGAIVSGWRAARSVIAALGAVPAPIPQATPVAW